MRVLVTGASGFIGREVVRQAAAKGHDVTALVRPTADVESFAWPETVSIVRGDLRQVGDWSTRLSDIEAVVHLAAVLSGDLPTQFSGTVVATENLLRHLPLKSLRRFVHVSSFSVYDYGAVGFRGKLNEAIPVDPKPERRDAYTITKVVQERVVTEAARAAGTHLVVIRPGAIIGPGKDWEFGRVIKLGRFDVIFSPEAKFPMTYVANCAEAIVKALDAQVPCGAVYNIVDDDLPSYYRYHRMGRRRGAAGVGPAIYLPWPVVRLIGASVSLINHLAFKGRARIPEFLDSRRQRVRWRPMSYSNLAAKQDLGWSPATPLRTAVDEIIQAQPRLTGDHL